MVFITIWVCRACFLSSPIKPVQIINSNNERNKWEAFWNRHVWSVLFRFMWQQKQQAQQPLLTGVRWTPRSPLRTRACSTSSASAPSQIILSTVVCLCAVFHYPACVSTALQTGPIWICQGITCCWMGHCEVNARQEKCWKRNVPIF